MRVLGITGGTGAGKSIASRRFETHDMAVIDADKIGHTLTEPSGDAVGELLEAFGASIFSCGKISRERLGALVFSDAAALATLNEIMQPRIAVAIGRRCAELAASDVSVCMVDAALLGDNGALEPCLEGLILVCCPEEIRVERLVNDRGLTPAVAWQRVRGQVDPETKRPLARWVIENDSTLVALHEQVDAIASALLADDGSHSHGTL